VFLEISKQIWCAWNEKCWVLLNIFILILDSFVQRWFDLDSGATTLETVSQLRQSTLWKSVMLCVTNELFSVVAPLLPVCWTITFQMIFLAKYKPQFGFVVVQKRINTRIFSRQSRGIQNPGPGTVVDHTITNRNVYDFFLVIVL
jgi:hypothetical protein